MSTRRAEERAGQKFEQQVADLYESLGFTVTINSRVGGQQVDIVAEKTAIGQGRTRIAIECKYLSKGNIGNQTVHDFCSAYRNIRDDGQFDYGIIVTNKDFTSGAKDAAENEHSVRLFTYDQLVQSHINIDSALREFVRSYETWEIYNNYLRLPAIVRERYGESSMVEDAEESIVRILKDSATSAITVIGDFGSGKTTLLHRLKYVLAKKHFEGAAQRPILFLLRDFNRVGSLEALITLTFQREFGLTLHLDAFWRNVEAGRFIFLLDGLDEMTADISEARRLLNLHVLARLIYSRSKAVLSCRPAYFISLEEYERFLTSLNQKAGGGPIKFADQRMEFGQQSAKRDRAEQAQRGKADMEMLQGFLQSRLLSTPEGRRRPSGRIVTLELAGLRSAQIDLYFQRHSRAFRQEVNADWRDVKSSIEAIYDLSDLMRRPFLLDMIVQSALAGVIDIRNRHANMGPFGLYEAYTRHKLRIEYEDKAEIRRFLTTEQRMFLSEAVAVAMLTKGRLEITYEELIPIAVERSRALGGIDADLRLRSADDIASDMRLCTFLTLGEDGMFRFCHKSFMEFFVARHIGARCSDGDFSLMSFPLGKEVKYFLGSLTMLRPELWSILCRKLQSSAASGIIRDNLGSTLLFMAGVVPNVELEQFEADHIAIAKSEWRGTRMSEVVLRGVSIKDLKASNCHLNNLTLQGANASDWHVFRSEISAQVRQCTMGQGCTLDECDTDLVTSDSSLEGLLVRRGQFCVRSTEMSRSRLLGCVMERLSIGAVASCDIENLSASESSLNFENCLVRKGRFVNKCNLEFLGSNISELNAVNSRLRVRSLCTVDKGELISCSIVGSESSLVHLKLNGGDVDGENLKLLHPSMLSASLKLCHGEIRGGEAKDVVLQLDQSMIEEATMSSCRITLTDSRLIGGSLEDCRVKLSAGSEVGKSSLAGVHIIGEGRLVDSLLRGRSRIEKASIDKCGFESASDISIFDSKVTKCRRAESIVSKICRSTLDGCGFAKCNLELEGVAVGHGTIFEDCEIEVRSSFSALAPETEGSVIFRDCNVNVSCKMAPAKARYEHCKIINQSALPIEGSLKECEVMGVLIQDLSEIRTGVFRDCSGLFFLHTERPGFGFEFIADNNREALVFNHVPVPKAIRMIRKIEESGVASPQKFLEYVNSYVQRHHKAE